MARNDELDQVLSDSRMTDEAWRTYNGVLAVSEETYLSIKDKQVFFNSEIRHVYGHSIANVFHNEYEPDYIDILKSTADKLKVPIEEHHTFYDIEEKIIIRVMDIVKARIIKEQGEEEWRRMESEIDAEVEEAIKSERIKGAEAKLMKSMGGSMFLSTIMAGRMAGPVVYIVANYLFRGVLSLGIRTGAIVAGPIVVGGPLALLLGPAGWILGGLWTIYDLGNTNWKKVIPAVIVTAMFRRQFEFKSIA